MEERLADVPASLGRHLESIIALDASLGPPGDVFEAQAMRIASEVNGSGGQDEGIKLLVLDALVTYACEARADDV